MSQKPYTPHAYLKLTRTIHKVITFFYYASMVILVILALAALATLVLPKSTFDISHFRNGSFSFQLNGPIWIDYDAKSLPKETSFRSIYTAIIGASFIVTLVYYNVLKHMRLILIETLKKNPFGAENARHLILIASTLFGAAFTFPVFTLLISERIIAILGLTNHHLNYAPDVNLIFASLLIFLLSGIFRYGTFLQTEYDETL